MNVTCDSCNVEMSPGLKTCVGNAMVKFPDGRLSKPIPYEKNPHSLVCHDCNIAVGGHHHPGCDMERCPKCMGQLISCGCLDS